MWPTMGFNTEEFKTIIARAAEEDGRWYRWMQYLIKRLESLKLTK